MSVPSVITPERGEQEKRSRFNPLANLSPLALTAQMDAFAIGYLPAFARTLDKMIERDDMLKAVVPKRCKDASRRPWRIVEVDADGDEALATRAAAHKKALYQFYNNLTAVDALDEDRRGGARLLIQQMMSAMAFGKAAHEILWQPDGGGSLTAEFRFVPLWFFENTTARLRFLPHEGSISGVALEPNKWLVTAGDNLGPASAVAYIYKHLPLRDWLSYCERFGMPYVQGKTAARKGTDEWRAMLDAVLHFMGDGSAVTGRDDVIELLTAAS
jgi:phage gp29-like protein